MIIFTLAISQKKSGAQQLSSATQWLGCWYRWFDLFRSQNSSALCLGHVSVVKLHGTSEVNVVYLVCACYTGSLKALLLRDLFKW